MKFCVIGLGRFGYHVATTLADYGMEVLAIDSNESIVASIRDNVTQAICMRVRDEVSLRSIGIEEMETVVVAMGDDFAASVLITALLKKRIKVGHVVARAINDIHKEILLLTGADEVILPEQEIGVRVADNLVTPFTELIRMTKDFSISQITPPEPFIGKRIQELDLYNAYSVHCIGVKHNDEVILVDPNLVVQKGDLLIFAGKNKDLETVAKL